VELEKSATSSHKMLYEVYRDDKTMRRRIRLSAETVFKAEGKMLHIT
jgi:hypothetical protein